VDEADAAGLAAAFGLGEKRLRSESAIDVLFFAGGALAMVFSVQQGIVGGDSRSSP
jgi:hypothetical protein